MFRIFAFAALMTATTLLPVEMSSVAAQTASETTYRLPKTGVPALSVAVPATWTANYDQFGNLLLFAPSKHSFFQLSVLSVAGIGATSPSDVATMVLKAVPAEPYSRTEPDSIDAEPGNAFISTATQSDITFDLRLILVKVDADDYAMVGKVIRRDATVAELATLNDLASRVRIVR